MIAHFSWYNYDNESPRAGINSRGLRQSRISTMSTSDHTTIPLTKHCSKCGNEYPATNVYFYPKKGSKYNLSSNCRECIKSRSREYRSANPDKVREMNHSWYLKNREKANKTSQEWNATHPESFNASKRKWRNANIEHSREYHRNWRAANRDKSRSYSRKWKRLHYETALEIDRIRHRNKPDRAKANDLRREARKLMLPASYTADDWNRSLSFFGYTCAYCGRQRGLWNPMTADHFIPLSSPECPGTVPSNMIPACRSCNSSKNDANPIGWVITKFGARKAKKILNRIRAYIDSLTQDAEKDM